MEYTYFYLSIITIYCGLSSGAWTSVRNGCIKDKNIWKGFFKSIENCKKFCYRNKCCRSIEYRMTRNECHLSNFTSSDVDYYEPCYENPSDWLFAEYSIWKEVRSACIRGNNYHAYLVNSLEECKLKCQQDSRCRSVDYRGINGLCHLSEATSESYAYTEPCYTQGYVYTERTDRDYH